MPNDTYTQLPPANPATGDEIDMSSVTNSAGTAVKRQRVDAYQLDEQGNQAQASDGIAIWQAMLTELRAIRLGIQHLISLVDESSVGGYNLAEIAQEAAEDTPIGVS